MRKGSYLCLDCRKGLRIKGYEARPPKSLDRVIYALKYDQLVARLIKVFKYRLCKDLGRSLGIILAEVGRKYFVISNYVVVPVALDKWKRRQRGFNQADILASGFSGVEQILGRRVKKQAQAGLGRRERLSNLEGLFFVKDAEKIVGKKVLLIDDVMTTGSTLRCCAEVLLAAGALSVSALVLARRS